MTSKSPNVVKVAPDGNGEEPLFTALFDKDNDDDNDDNVDNVDKRGQAADSGFQFTFQEVFSRLQKDETGSGVDDDNDWSKFDRFLFVAENMIASVDGAAFYILFVIFVILVVALAVLWLIVLKLFPEISDGSVYGYNSFYDSLFLSVQLFTSAGYDDSLPLHLSIRTLYLLMIVLGLIIFAILVGFITDAITNFMESINSGTTKITINDHTLILGYSEATLRLICQLAFVRRQYIKLYERNFMARWFVSWRPEPSTVLATSKIVILTDKHSKQELQDMIREIFSERGLGKRRTKIGKDVIVRVGDPTSITDLNRVNAAGASTIIVMNVEDDEAELEKSNNRNGISLRTLLALRVIVFSQRNAFRMRPQFRINVQLSSYYPEFEELLFSNQSGTAVVNMVDISKYLNKLMFACANQPGLANVLLDMLNLDGHSLRLRKAIDISGGPNETFGWMIGKKFQECVRSIGGNSYVVGVINGSGTSVGDGFVPSWDYIIKKTDDILFISEKSLPKYSNTWSLKKAQYQQEAKEIIEPSMTADMKKKRSSLSQIPYDNLNDDDALNHFLVLGWRKVWITTDTRLYERIGDLLKESPQGSSVTFGNRVPYDIFQKKMEDLGISKIDIPSSSDNNNTSVQKAIVYKVTIESKLFYVRHFHCNPAMSEQTAHLFTETNGKEVSIVQGNNPNYDHAIAICTQYDESLEKTSEDTRILNICLILRNLWKKRAAIYKEKFQIDIPELHIVAENREDRTSLLAIGPIKKSKISKFDFINSQAIQARCLAQIVCYPKSKQAINNLFSTDDPVDILVEDCINYVPLGIKLSIGALQEYLMSSITAEKGSTLMLGYITEDHKTVWCPSADKQVTFQADMKLLLAQRDLIKEEKE